MNPLTYTHEMLDIVKIREASRLLGKGRYSHKRQLNLIEI